MFLGLLNSELCVSQSQMETFLKAKCNLVFFLQTMFALLRLTALVGGADYDGDFEFTGATEFNPAGMQPYKAPSEFYRNEAAGDGLFKHKTVNQNNVGGIRGEYRNMYSVEQCFPRNI